MRCFKPIKIYINIFSIGFFFFSSCIFLLIFFFGSDFFSDSSSVYCNGIIFWMQLKKA